MSHCRFANTPKALLNYWFELVLNQCGIQMDAVEPPKFLVKRLNNALHVRKAIGPVYSFTHEFVPLSSIIPAQRVRQRSAILLRCSGPA